MTPETGKRLAARSPLSSADQFWADHSPSSTGSDRSRIAPRGLGRFARGYQARGCLREGHAEQVVILANVDTVVVASLTATAASRIHPVPARRPLGRHGPEVVAGKRGEVARLAAREVADRGGRLRHRAGAQLGE